MNGITKGKAAAYLAAVFVVGLVAGGAAGFTLARHRLFHLPPPQPQVMASRMVDRLQAELGLSLEQVRKLEPIAAQAAQELETIHREVAGRVLEGMKRTNRRIDEFLTPQQQEKLRALEQKHAESFRRNASEPATPSAPTKSPP